MNFDPQTYEELIRMKRLCGIDKILRTDRGGTGGDLSFPGTKPRGFR